ncbi:DegT/DnrJ/EryC1/StrS family aminotransferase [Candidatus Saccharibacteria bacterium]|nr:DegT/DnrJ/EryC1/StrS family aminotransferase [Candidatus Saccharibacteria bacterium]
MIFLSFAPEFNFSRAIRHLLTIGSKKHSAKLKEELQNRYQGTHVQLFHNGRTALSEAIKAIVPKGSHIVVNGLTCYAVHQAVKAADCNPIYVDINSQDFNFDINQLSLTLSEDPKIKAIIIQNHLGLAADIVSIEKLAEKYGLIIIEDLAHCAGSHYADGREMGTVGAVAALSFGKNKSIDTTEGGALVIRETASALGVKPAKAKSLRPVTTGEVGGTVARDDGPTPIRSSRRQVLPRIADRARDRIYPITGWLIRKTYGIGLGKAIASCAFKTGAIVRSAEGDVNPRLRPAHWQAKLALRQLRELNQTAKIRAQFAAQYGYPKTSSIIRIPFLVSGRSVLLKTLQTHGIHLNDSWYDIPVSPKRYYHKVDFPEKSCPVASRVASQMLNLPLLPKNKLKPALEIIQKAILT